MTLPIMFIVFALAAALAMAARIAVLKACGLQEALSQGTKDKVAGNANSSGKLKDLVKTLGDASPIQSSHAEDYRTRLVQAGLHIDLSTWRGLQILSALIGVLLALSLAVQSLDAAHLFLAAIIAALGLFGPRLILSSLTRDRHRKIEASLASTLELLALAVKSGYPLERAIKLVGKNTKGPLSEEFRQIDTDINLLGMDLERALKRLRTRCDVPGLSSFAIALTQAYRQGSSVTRVLEAQAREARNSLYAAQLEQINKLPAKLVAPIFGIMMLIIVIALVPPIYDTVVLFSSSYSNAGDINSVSSAL